MVLGKTKYKVVKKAVTPHLEKGIINTVKRFSKQYKSEKETAEAIKIELDEKYGAPWIVIVGRKFGGRVTYIPNHMMYFQIDDIFYLVYSTRNMTPADGSNNK